MSRIHAQQPSTAPMPQASAGRAKETTTSSFEFALGTVPHTREYDDQQAEDRAPLSAGSTLDATPNGTPFPDPPPTAASSEPSELTASLEPGAPRSMPGARPLTPGGDAEVAGEMPPRHPTENESDVVLRPGLSRTINIPDAATRGLSAPPSASDPTLPSAQLPPATLSGPPTGVPRDLAQSVESSFAADADLTPVVKPSNEGSDLLYPQTLMAIGRLSYQSGSDAPRPSGPDISGGSLPASLAPSTHSLAAPMLAAQMNATSTSARQALVTSATPMPSLQSDAIIANEALMPVASKSRNLVAALPWAPKLFRITCDAEGTATVWIRDFALDSESMESLVRSIQRATGAASMFVNRIVVNGHTVWSALPGEY